VEAATLVSAIREQVNALDAITEEYLAFARNLEATAGKDPAKRDRAAAEIDPVECTLSRSAALPGPMRAPDSITIVSRRCAMPRR